MEERGTGMSNDIQRLQLPADIHNELLRLTHEVEVTRIRLENAELRRELAVRRAITTLGISAEKVEFDLQLGFVELNESRRES